MDNDVSQKIKLVDKYINDLTKELLTEFGGMTYADLKTAIEKIIAQEELMSRDEEVVALAKIITGKGEITPEIEMSALKIVMVIDSWQKQNISEVRKYRAEKFEENFVKKTQDKNPNLTDEKVKLVKQKAKLVSRVYFSEGGIENQRELAIQNNNENISW